jgi:protein gp37
LATKSSIEWTEVTWNPVTGCDRISPGCDNCYAMAMAKRLKGMGAPKYQNDGDPNTSGPGFGVSIHPTVLDEPRRWRDRKTVFVNSMGDMFHPRVPLEFVQEVFDVIEQTPQHTYQLLTKRPIRARRLAGKLPWPNNLWLGTSVESSSYFGRIDELGQVPAAIRFLSCEPLLGGLEGIDLCHVSWVIAGGESGPHARAVEPEWVRGLRDNCRAGGVPFFFKQWGGRTPKANGRLLDGRTWSQMPMTTTSPTA